MNTLKWTVNEWINVNTNTSTSNCYINYRYKNEQPKMNNIEQTVNGWIFQVMNTKMNQMNSKWLNLCRNYRKLKMNDYKGMVLNELLMNEFLITEAWWMNK